MAEGRVFVRGIVSENYDLQEVRKAQLAAPRVRGPEFTTDDGKVGYEGGGKDTKSPWRLGPGDDPFLTQTLQIHTVEMAPGKSNAGHGHQNEAAFYILEGHGHEIHDGERYEWGPGDLVMVHTDSMHRHFNDSETERAVCLVMKAKSTWMYFGLLQQGLRKEWESSEGYGPREDWSQLWTPGVTERKKVVKAEDADWEITPDGKVRVLASDARNDVRCHSVDVYEQEIPEGSRSSKHWHMADEALYVISGSGYSLHWEVQAEIDDKYYARIAEEPTRHDFKAGDVLYIPQNTIHQHFADDGEPLVFVSAQNRLFKALGYDNVAILENAPEYDALNRELSMAGAQ